MTLLDNLSIPTVERPNGIAYRKSASTKEYNHDGLAFQGLNDRYVAAAIAHAEMIKNGYTFFNTTVGRPVLTVAGQTTDSEVASSSESVKPLGQSDSSSPASGTN